MVLRIRLARFGNKHLPFYNIVVAQARYVCCYLPTPDPSVFEAVPKPLLLALA
jgi:small subunit ribosomal protein S16